MNVVVGFALISSICRAMLNIFDRVILGINKKNFRLTILLNNMLPLISLLIILFSVNELSNLTSFIMSGNVFIFALIYQGVSYSFSYAFLRNKVQQVILFSKPKFRTLKIE